MPNLKQQAEDLGIKVDDRWSDATLQAKIDQAKKDKGGPEVINAGTNAGPSKAAAAGEAVADDGSKLQTEATPKAVKSKVTLDPKTILIAKALELNIEVDEDWDEARLQGEIQMAREGRADLQVKGAVPPAEMSDPDYDPATKADKDVEVLLTHDYWPEEGNRAPAGTKVKVSRDNARKLINDGKAQRTDPL